MNYQKVTKLSTAQAARLTELYQQAWWTAGRTAADTARMLASPNLVFGLAEPPGGRLVGFARVLSDGVFKALIFDVIVDPACRGEGLGAVLMTWIKTHPALARVKHFELYCRPELVPFYERWGFTTEVGDVVLMREVAR